MAVGGASGRSVGMQLVIIRSGLARGTLESALLNTNPLGITFTVVVTA